MPAARTSGGGCGTDPPMKIDPKELGQRIATARKAAGFRSQEALANAVGMAREAINRIENGRATPTTENLYAIAAACLTTPEALTGADEGYVASAEARRLIKAFQRSSDALALVPPATEQELLAAEKELSGGAWLRLHPTTRTVAILISAMRSAVP